MQGERSTGPAQVGDVAPRVERAQAAQQLARGLQRGRRRRVQPGQRLRVESCRADLQHGPGQVEARDLGSVVLRPGIEVVPGVQAQRASRAETSGAAGPLGGGSAADLGHVEGRQSRPGRMARDPRQSAVDDGGDSGDGDAGLRHVGAQDDLAPPRRGQRPVLLRGRQVSVEGKQEQVALSCELRAGLGRVADLGRARQEHQYVALRTWDRQPADGGGDLVREPTVVGSIEVLDLDRETPAFAADHRRAQLLGEGARVEGGGHDHELEARQEALRQRQGQIARQVALVELVEHERAHAGQLRVGEDAPGEDPLGHVPEARARCSALLEADLPAHLIGVGQLLRDAFRRRAGGDAARLEDDDFALDDVEQRRRHPGRLSRAGGSFQHDGGMVAQRP